MNEEQRNEQVIQELDEIMPDLYSDVVFNPNIDRNTYYPVALQIAKHITAKEYKEFRLTYEADSCGTCVSIYYERVLQEGGYFISAKYTPKQCIGVLICDIEKNRIIFKKTNANTEIHVLRKDEKGQMEECFGVSSEIFKYLRDNDLIQICTIERKTRYQQSFTYTITKSKAVNYGCFLHLRDYGIQFFIPKADFKRVEGKRISNKTKNKKK